MVILRNNKDTNNTNNNEAASSVQPGDLPEEVMVVLCSIHGSPNNRVEADFLEFCHDCCFHMKDTDSLGGASVKDFCEALHNDHFEHWAAAQAAEDVCWPVNGNTANAA